MKIQTRRWSNRHSHIRTGDMQKRVIGSSNLYDNVLCKGNLPESVDRAERFLAYKSEVIGNKPQFKPYLGIMMTKDLTPAVIEEAFDCGAEFLATIFRSASTGSDTGIDIDEVEKYYPHYAIARRRKKPTLWHMERPYRNGKPIPLLYQEEEAVPDAEKIRRDLPGLLMSIEHVSTLAMINFVESARDVIGTLTTHHALGTYDWVCDEKGNIINYLFYCKPILKRERDRHAVEGRMTSGNYTKWRKGTDSAPHFKTRFEGLPGIFMPDIVDMALTTQVFEKRGCLGNLEGFVSVSPTDIEFYGWDFANDFITLVKEEWIAPKEINGVVPFMAGQKLSWKVAI